MAKKAKALKEVEVNAEVKVKKTRVIDTPKTDVVLTSNEEEKKFVLDSRKLDVEVTKTNEGTTVKVEGQTPMLQRAGKWIAHMMSKKLNRK
jgi:RNase P/RNase MRP subunit p29